MKAVSIFLVAAIVVVECNHLFLGTNVNRPLVYHQNVQRRATGFRNSISDNFYFQLPNITMVPRSIQGILAVDLNGSKASANVTEGGIGYGFVKLRMKSERGQDLRYDIFIYR